MKGGKDFLKVMSGILCAFFALANVTADEMSFKERFYLEPEVMAVLPDNEDDQNLEDEFDPGVFIGGRLGFKLSSWTSIEFESGYVQFEEDVQDIQVAELSMIPLLANVKIDLASGRSRFSPYVYVGLGGSLNDYELDQEASLAVLSDALSVDVRRLGLTLSADVENGFAVQGGGGFLYRLSEHWTIFAEARYLHASFDVHASVSLLGVTVDFADDDELNMVMAGAGLRFSY